MWTSILIGSASGALACVVLRLISRTIARPKAALLNQPAGAGGVPAPNRADCSPGSDLATPRQAIAHGQPYCDVPSGLEIPDPANYVQPWSGYCPPDELQGPDPHHDRACQRANIKPPGQYARIEVGDNAWVRMACDEARAAVAAGGGPFGAVLLQIDDETHEVIRYWRTHNRVNLENDPSAHAEVLAIRSACCELGVFHLGRIERAAAKLPQRGATSHCEIYSSSEPCPMCFAAIAWARLGTLVFAATRHDAAAPGVDFSDAAIYAELAKPYHQRSIKTYQATTDISLDAFNLWKRSPKTPY